MQRLHVHCCFFLVKDLYHMQPTCTLTRLCDSLQWGILCIARKGLNTSWHFLQTFSVDEMRKLVTSSIAYQLKRHA
jgi:hypothetical protein